MNRTLEGSTMKQSKWIVGALLVVLALGLLLGACGTTTDESSTTVAPATTATTSTPTTAPASSDTTAPASTDTTAASTKTETLRIGVVLQLTDWYSAVDALEKPAVEQCAKMINDEGGIKVGDTAYMIELVEEDGKSTMDGNTAAATKLVLDEKVQFVIGTAGPFNVATTPIFEQAKVLHVASYNALAPGEMDSTTTYEFLGLDPIAQQDMNLKALKQLYPDVKTVCMATEDSSYPYLEKGFLALFEKNGFTPSGDTILFSTQAEDYSGIVTKIKSQNPDALWLPISIPPTQGAIIKGLRTLGWNGPIVWSNYAPMTLGLVGPEAANNLINTLSVDYQKNDNPPLIDKIMSLGDPTTQWFGMAPNGLYMLKNAIEAAQSIDPAAVRDKWETLDSIPTVYGEGYPSGNELYGLHNHAWAYPCAVVQIMNGELIYKGWIKPDPTP